VSKNDVTLKTGLEFVQGHWKMTDRIRVPICILWRYLVSSVTYSKSRNVYIPPVFSTPAGGDPV